MTQYFDGRRGRFWQASPKGSEAAQCGCPAPIAGLEAFGADLDAALEGALACPLRTAFLGAALVFVARAALLPAFLAAFLGLAGLIGADQAAHPAPALKSDDLAAAVPGLWYEQFEPGAVIEHRVRLQVTQEDNVAFCRLTLNTQPLHLDEAAARRAGFPKPLVNGLYTFSAAVGASVEDTTAGTLVANLAYADVEHPRPVFPGDTLSFRTEVVEKRPSSKPGRGVVTLLHRALNQEGDEVCRFKRTVMVHTRPRPEVPA